MDVDVKIEINISNEVKTTSAVQKLIYSNDLGLDQTITFTGKAWNSLIQQYVVKKNNFKITAIQRSLV